jgi:nitronate monooxygenase
LVPAAHSTHNFPGDRLRTATFPQNELGTPVSPTLPKLIQGGMGVGISNWRLAKAVAAAGHLGVVSGTSIDTLLVRRLQDGDADDAIQRAARAFPWPEVAERILRRWLRPRGERRTTPYELVPLPSHELNREASELLVFASFVEVWLAREGHHGAVGINLLTKIQCPTAPTLYGAMLAGVQWVFMGAGIPRHVPNMLAKLAKHEPVLQPLDVVGAREPILLAFDPELVGPRPPAGLLVPRFVPIVSSHSLAVMMARKAQGPIAGFIVERPSAGGHNAPPRAAQANAGEAEPVYGPRDEVDFAVLRDLGLPFWIAGGAGKPGALAAALAEGAVGIQVGTLFAFCQESGLAEPLKAAVHNDVLRGSIRVRTDGRASPTGYPFKTVAAPSLPVLDTQRRRVCDLGYLRTTYLQENGKIGYRCPAEPVASYVRKGGLAEETSGRLCLCNALQANAGH